MNDMNTTRYSIRGRVAKSLGAGLMALLAFGFLLAGCTKTEDLFDEPYGPGKEALALEIDRFRPPVPASGLPGATVSIFGSGFLQFKDQLVFRFNGEQAEIVEVTDTEIKVIVPDYASTGTTSISVDDIVVFGPQFSVTGFVRLDPTFVPLQGANNSILDYMPLADGKAIMVGYFTNYDNRGIIRPINRIVRTFPDGSYDASLRSGWGANGGLNTVTQIGDKLFIGGGFSGYDQRTENISNLTMLNLNGTIDTMGVSTWRRPDQLDTIKYFATFNGGFNAAVDHLYPQGDKLLATGNFRYYVSRQYDKPNRLEVRDTVILDSTEIRQLARLNLDGSIDRSYRFNAEGTQGLTGANGNIRTYLHTEGDLAGKLVVFGSFTRFDDQPANYIIRLNADGTIDPTFNPGGAGADYNVDAVSYNQTTGKYTLLGPFRQYNGQTAQYLVQLNADGTFFTGFVPQAFVGGLPKFAKQLDDGLVVVSGDFRTYGGVARNGFMILDDTGKLAPGYNATGLFRGSLNDVVETRSADNRRALLLIGGFDRFNGEQVSNLARITLE